MGLRRQHDGGWFVTRTNDPAAIELAKKYKYDDGAWYPRTHLLKDPFELADIHKGKTLQIVGKGPSLDMIRSNHFIDGPILCINESIQVIDRIDQRLATYVLQFDGSLQESCRPQKATLLLGWPARGYYESYPNRIVFNPKELFDVSVDISAAYALRFAKLFGCVGVNMLAFDSVVGELGYANVGGPIKRAMHEHVVGERFKSHREHLERLAAALRLPLKWIPTWEKPKGTLFPLEEFGDSPLQEPQQEAQ